MPPASELERRITKHFDTLSPKQQAIARLIVDNRYFASFASAAEIGDKVDASAATVVRLCQVLGYGGLPDLQEAIRRELPSYLTAVERLERRVTVPAENGHVPQRAFAADILNLQRTVDSLATVAFDEAVDALASAQEVIVVGAGVAAFIAEFLAYSLQVIGYRARAVTGGGIALAVNLAHLRPEDVVVGVSVWRYVRATVDALQQARTHGARTIAITDSIVSPLARHAEIAFEVATDGIAHSLSTTAMLALVNALVAAISLRDPARTGESLRRVDSEFHARDLLLE